MSRLVLFIFLFFSVLTMRSYGSQRKALLLHPSEMAASLSLSTPEQTLNFYDLLKSKLKKLSAKARGKIDDLLHSEKIRLRDVDKTHSNIFLKFGLPPSVIGPGLYYYLAQLREIEGVQNFVTMHSSNALLGFGVILMFHNVFVSAAPELRRQIEWAVISFFTLGNLYYETPLFGFRDDTDVNDLGVGLTTILIAYAIQRLAEYKELKKLGLD